MRDGQGVMRAENGRDKLALRQQTSGASHIGNIGVDLAGIDGKIAPSPFLPAFDFGVPIGALDQTDMQAAMMSLSEGGKKVDRRRRALVIGLNGKAQTVPAMLFHPRHHFGGYFKGKLKPVAFFGIDGQSHAQLGGAFAQSDEARHKLMHHAGMLRHFIARVQGR